MRFNRKLLNRRKEVEKWRLQVAWMGQIWRMKKWEVEVVEVEEVSKRSILRDPTKDLFKTADPKIFEFEESQKYQFTKDFSTEPKNQIQLMSKNLKNTILHYLKNYYKTEETKVIITTFS